jgi:hypothetical protein
MKINQVLTSVLAISTLSAALFANAQTMQSDTMSSVLQSTKLIAVGAPTTGTLEIIKKADGSRVLNLKNIKTEAGPDLHVYLYVGNIPGKDAKNIKTVKYVDLGKLAAPFKGNYSYNIPANTKLEQFKSVVIWCDVAKVTFAGAKLK